MRERRLGVCMVTICLNDEEDHTDFRRRLTTILRLILPVECQDFFLPLADFSKSFSSSIFETFSVQHSKHGVVVLFWGIYFGFLYLHSMITWFPFHFHFHFSFLLTTSLLYEQKNTQEDKNRRMIFGKQHALYHQKFLSSIASIE